MSYNYKSHQLLTGNRTTQFKVITGDIETRYILLRDSNYYGLLNPNKPFEIYSLVPSKKRNIPDYIGEGSNVQIHLMEQKEHYLYLELYELLIVHYFHLAKFHQQLSFQAGLLGGASPAFMAPAAPGMGNPLLQGISALGGYAAS